MSQILLTTKSHEKSHPHGISHRFPRPFPPEIPWQNHGQSGSSTSTTGSRDTGFTAKQSSTWHGMLVSMGISKGNGWEIDGKYHGFMGFPREIDGKYDGYMMGYEWNIHENIIRTECNGGFMGYKTHHKNGSSLSAQKTSSHPIRPHLWHRLVKRKFPQQIIMIPDVPNG